MSGTTVALARSWLVELFGRHPSLQGVEVFYALPIDPNKIPREFVGCSGVEATVDGIATIKAGRQRRQEDYVLRWHVGVKGVGDDAPNTDARATEMVAAVEETIADNGTLNGIRTSSTQQIVYCQVDGIESAEGPLPDGGYGFEYVVRVAVSARLL